MTSQSITKADLTGNALVSVIERAATNPDVDIDKMERLLAMQERIVQRDAEVAFSVAMIKCQEAMPTVGKTADNPQTRSKYASLDHIQELTKPVAAAHGFATSFGTEESPLEHHLRVVADVLHEQGYSKRYTYDSPVVTTGIKGTTNMTLTHAAGSAMSYGQRYLTKLIWNLTLGGEDDDGNAATPSTTGRVGEQAPNRLNGVQRTTITELLNKTNTDPEQFCAWIAQCHYVEQIPVYVYDRAVATLEKKLDRLSREYAESQSAPEE